MKVLQHLDHVEDLILTEGTIGGLDAVNLLSDIAHGLSPSGSIEDYTIKEKVDGSPAIIAGWCPITNNFFVATKSIFNKTPKVNWSLKDIFENHENSPGLIAKLRLALVHLPRVIKSGIYQGDFMFDETDRHCELSHVSFKPNTIEYRLFGEEADKAMKAKLGIIWHTAYEGKIGDLRVKFDDDLLYIGEHPDVWMADVDFKNEYGFANFNALERSMFHAGFKTTIQKVQSCNNLVDEIFVRDEEISKLAMIFINKRIRSGKKFINREESLFQFLEFVGHKYIKAIDKLITEKAKNAKIKALKKITDDILLKEGWRVAIMDAFETHHWIQTLKEIVINKLEQANKQSEMKSFINRIETGPEGYVVSRGSMAVKLVNRLEFSRANFNIMKEWK